MDKIGTEKTEELIRKYSDMIYRIALHNIGNIADAEDVLQDVWFEYIKRNPQTEDEERLKAWLIRVTINKCRSLYRLFWRRNCESLEDHTELIAPEQRKILEEVRSLPKDSRNIVYLYYYESYTIAEIAKILGKNQNTVSSALQRARRKLKELLEEGDEEYVK